MLLLGGKNIKRLDKTIHQLFLFLQDKTIQRIINLNKGNTVNCQIVSKHRLAVILKLNLIENDLSSWTVQNNETGKFHTVAKSFSTPCCSIKCSFCNICVHSNSCSCTDFIVKATICKHIHYIILNTNSDILHASTSEITEESITYQNLNNDKISELILELNTLSNHPDKNKDRVQSNYLQIIGNIDKGNLSQDQIKLLLENTNAGVALSEIKPNIQLKTVEENIKEPVNKKTSNQRSFFSIKKILQKKLQI